MPETAPAPPQVAAAPRPLSPTGGERVDATSISLYWSEVPGAEDYELQVAASEDFRQPLLALNTGPTTGVSLYDSLPTGAGELYWRARAAHQQAWGPAGRFAVAEPEPAEPVRHAHHPPPAAPHPEWEARREEAVAAMSLEDQESMNHVTVAWLLALFLASFIALLLVLFVMGQVTYQGEVFPN